MVVIVVIVVVVEVDVMTSVGMFNVDCLLFSLVLFVLQLDKEFQ